MPTPAAPSTNPSWTPTLAEVADYCTARTLLPQPDGSNVEVSAFTASTRPSDAQAERLIADAVAWVQLKTGAVDASLAVAANAVACQRTAGMIELRFPERQSANREDAITTAKELLKQADQMRADLADANEAVTGDNPEDPAAHVLPYWSFPDAPIETCYRY